MARGVRIEDWDCPEGLALLREWSILSLEEIAKHMGITRTTLSRWCEKSDNIRAVLYDPVKCAKVEKAVYDSCFDRVKEVVIKKQVLDKQGQVVELVERKQIALPADGQSQRYWLKNRNPNRWRDKVEVAFDQNSSDSGTVVLPDVVFDEMEGEKKGKAETDAGRGEDGGTDG